MTEVLAFIEGVDLAEGGGKQWSDVKSLWRQPTPPPRPGRVPDRR